MTTIDPLADSLRSAELTRRQVLRGLGLGGLALAAPAALAACGSSDNEGTSAATSTPKISNAQLDRIIWSVLEIRTLDIAKGGDPAHTGLVTEPVVKYDDSLNVVGHLAEKWRAADDRTYVYTVRQGVKFTDGTPLMPEDVAYAITRHKDPKTASQYAGQIPDFESVEVTAPNEVTVKLKKPNATWSYLPTYMDVAPKAFFKKLGKDYGSLKASSILGSGPYLLDKVTPVSLEMSANPDYWGKKQVTKKLSLKVIRDQETNLLAMRSGDIDGTFDIQPALVDQWKQLSGVTVTTVPAPKWSVLSFDTAVKPWNDVHVRKAIAYAIDREGLIKALFKGNAALAEGVVPRPAIGGATKEQLDQVFTDVPQYEFDLDKAKAELAQSAYPNGFTDSIWYYNGDVSEKIALSLQANLKQLGINLKLDVPTDEEGAAREDEHKDLGFHLIGWAESGDMIEMPLLILLSSAAVKLQYNEANYRNPKMDELINRNVESIDPAERLKTIGEINKLNNEDLPYIPLWSTTQTVAIKEKYNYRALSLFYGRQQWPEHIEVKA